MLQGRVRPALLAAVVASAACARAAPARAARTLALAPCRLKGASVPALCGTLDVFENRATRAGRKIGLKVVVVPALARDARPDPLVLLAGGPGQSITEAVGPLLPAFEKIRRSRDLVLVDQRGTGGSHALDCELHPSDGRSEPGDRTATPARGGREVPHARPASLAESLAYDGFPPDKLAACLASYDADVRQYTTANAAADLDDVRAALGYERLNLWGGSYGTRLALDYLRRYPARVRTAVLDGVAPNALKLPLYLGRDAERALDLLFAECAADARCAAAFPDLRARFAKLLDRLAAEPARVTVSHPRTGAPSEVVITRDAFAAGLRGVLYAPEVAALLPLTIDRASRGDFGPYVAQAVALDSGFSHTMSLGLFLSVVCAEDAPAVREDEIAPASAGTFFGERLTRDLLDACKTWPHADAPAGWLEPVKSDAPVLLLSGELDPVTPPSWGDLAAQTLTHARHVVVPGVGHGATAQGCVPDLVAKFVAAGTVDGLDATCVAALRRPPFFLSFAGPTP